VRTIDVISVDTKLIITPFPEEYMLIVLYFVHDLPDWHKNASLGMNKEHN